MRIHMRDIKDMKSVDDMKKETMFESLCWMAVMVALFYLVIVQITN